MQITQKAATFPSARAGKRSQHQWLPLTDLDVAVQAVCAKTPEETASPPSFIERVLSKNQVPGLCKWEKTIWIFAISILSTLVNLSTIYSNRPPPEIESLTQLTTIVAMGATAAQSAQRLPVTSSPSQLKCLCLHHSSSLLEPSSAPGHSLGEGR